MDVIIMGKGWGVYYETCNECGHQSIAVIPAGTDLTCLECGKCGAQDSWAVPCAQNDNSTES